MTFIYDGKIVSEAEIPSTAIEVTTYEDLFRCIRQFIKGMAENDT